VASAIDPRLPSFKRVRSHLFHEMLHTSALSVYVFSVALPVAIFVVLLVFEISRRKAGTPVSVVIGSTVWPTVISVVLTAMAWVVLLCWSFLRVAANDKKELLSTIAAKDTEIFKTSEIMEKRDREYAQRVNQDAATIFALQENIRQFGSQMSLVEHRLYTAQNELAAERSRLVQPDVGLLWEWPADQRMVRALKGSTEKDILIHNRSNQFVYNVQIETVPLRQGLVFDLINEIPPNTECKAIGRWNDKSSLTSNYAYFFIGGEEEAQAWGWFRKKPHNRGMSDSHFVIPMAISYECPLGVKWRCNFEFTYDVGYQGETYFTKQSGQRVVNENMPKEYEYHEGKQAQGNFEEGMRALFQVPKDAVKGKKKPAKKRAKNDQSQTSESDTSHDSGEA
jgi:hypothetical protein